MYKYEYERVGRVASLLVFSAVYAGIFWVGTTLALNPRVALFGHILEVLSAIAIIWFLWKAIWILVDD